MVRPEIRVEISVSGPFRRFRPACLFAQRLPTRLASSGTYSQFGDLYRWRRRPQPRTALWLDCFRTADPGSTAPDQLPSDRTRNDALSPTDCPPFASKNQAFSFSTKPFSFSLVRAVFLCYGPVVAVLFQQGKPLSRHGLSGVRQGIFVYVNFLWKNTVRAVFASTSTLLTKRCLVSDSEDSTLTTATIGQMSRSQSRKNE